GRIDRGTASCTSPAPIRSAAVPARTGAPIMPSLPPTTSTRPKLPLCPSTGGGGSGGGEVIRSMHERLTLSDGYRKGVDENGSAAPHLPARGLRDRLCGATHPRYARRVGHVRGVQPRPRRPGQP